MVCTSGVTCSGDSDCGPGGVCDPTGTCGQNTTGGVCAGDENCPSGETCVDGHCGCTGVAFQAMPVTPNVMIVLDRSGSMKDPGDSSSSDSKWTIAGDALTALFNQVGGQVRFGLVTFSSDGSCGAGNVRVDIGDNTSMAIETKISGTSPKGSTPIVATMDSLVGNTELMDPDHPNYVLLVTDGEEKCDTFTTQPLTDLKNQSPSVKTFVVGFGAGIPNPDQLNDLATAGGTALSGNTKYYQANNASQLADALGSIIGSVLSCTYTLDQVPSDLSQLYVYEDGTAVDQDPGQQNGWDYDSASNTLTFYGPTCDALQNGTVTDVSIVYGCPSATPD